MTFMMPGMMMIMNVLTVGIVWFGAHKIDGGTMQVGAMTAFITYAMMIVMVKLLMRFYDVNSGNIRLGQDDIRQFNRRELRDAFGMVLQDTWLFKGTIMENIRYGRVDATDEEVIAAAKAARAHHFIQTLPGGYQMELNEDASNVSQGQKQLLTIARAILADNKILILVMKDGDIVEQGNHEELLKAGGFYANLYNSQFEDVVA